MINVWLKVKGEASGEAEQCRRSVFWGDTQVPARVSRADWKKITFNNYFVIYLQKGKGWHILNMSIMYFFKNDTIGGGGGVLEKSLITFISWSVLCSIAGIGSLFLVWEILLMEHNFLSGFFSFIYHKFIWWSGFGWIKLDSERKGRLSFWIFKWLVHPFFVIKI